MGSGLFPLEPELIAKNEPRTDVPAGTTAEYGEYLSRIAACRDCHGHNLAGGEDPNAPTGPNLTPGGGFTAYQTEDDFIKVIRTGETPGGRTLSEEMPWKEYQGMTDDELKALFAYLKSLDPLPTNGS